MSTTRFLPGQLTLIKKTHTHKNKTLKLVGKAGSASRLDSGLLKRGEIGGVNKKNGHLGMAPSEINWLGRLGDFLKEIILQHDVTAFV